MPVTYLQIHVVNQSSLERECSKCSCKGNEIAKERKESTEECAECKIRAARDETDKEPVNRKLTLRVLPFQFLGDISVHEFIHWSCINLWRSPS